MLCWQQWEDLTSTSDRSTASLRGDAHSCSVLCRHQRDDLADTVIAPAGAEAASAALSDLRDNAERLRKYLARLREVRSRRAAMEVSGVQAWVSGHGMYVRTLPHPGP